MTGLHGGNGDIDVFFQQGGVLVGVDLGAREQVVDVDEVEDAGVAVGEEFFEPGESGRAVAVCDGRGAELHSAGVGLHVFFVDGGCFFGGEVGLVGGGSFV